MSDVRLGLRENAAQFTLLVALNALASGMGVLERSDLPRVDERDFALTARPALLIPPLSVANTADGRQVLPSIPVGD